MYYYYSTFGYKYYTLIFMRERKVQSRIERELEEHVKNQEGFEGMSEYIRKALIQKSKFKKAQKKEPA